MILVSGTYGGGGAEYRTEIESFSKINSQGIAGAGPAYFVVKTKSGQTIEYGNTADSRIEAQGRSEVRVWALNRVTDTKGNYFTVSYTEDNANGDFHPTRIDYTANTGAGLAAGQSVRFSYQTRTDTTPQYVSGAMIKVMNRLTNVQTYVGETLTTDYRLAYTNAGSSALSQLSSLTECAGTSPCFPPVTFTWQVSSGSSSFSSASWGPAGAGVSGDFNGDGRADLFYVSDGELYVQYSTGSGFGAPTYVGGISCGDPCAPRLAAGDVNGDGLVDVILWNMGSSSVYLATVATPDLLTAFNTGLGASHTITYAKLSDSAVYTYESGSAFPVRDILAAVPIYVVKQTSSSNGIGGTVTTSLSYKGAKAHLHGRGFGGFRESKATDQGTGNSITTTRRQDYPYVGLPSQIDKTKSGGGLLSRVTNTFAAQALGGTRYFPYVAQSDALSYELNGAFVNHVRTTNAFDSYGNASEIVVTHLTESGGATGHSKTTTNTFTNDTTNWLLGRLTRSSVATSTP